MTNRVMQTFPLFLEIKSGNFNLDASVRWHDKSMSYQRTLVSRLNRPCSFILINNNGLSFSAQPPTKIIAVSWSDFHKLAADYPSGKKASCYYPDSISSTRLFLF